MTYIITIPRMFRGKDFYRAVELVKSSGAKFDSDRKVWTLDCDDDPTNYGRLSQAVSFYGVTIAAT